MKKYSKYHLPTLLFMLAAGFMSVSCADEDIAKDQKYDGKNGVSFSVIDVQDALDADIPTRATDAKTYLTHSIDFNEAGTSDICLQESTVPGVNPMKRTPQTRAWLKSTIDANFGAFACKNGSAGPDYFYNEQVTPSGQMLQPKIWASTASTLKFYAVYPYMDGTNTRQKLVQATTGSLPYVAFEASTDIANQTDLMTAETTPINYTSTGGAPHVVPLKFYHALTAIRFGIGSNLSWNKTIKSIEFQGIKNAGHFDLATKTWSNQSGAQTFKLDNVNKSTSEVQNTVIVKDGNTFLMVPQTLPSGAKIVITFADNSHITANIGGKTWAPGTTKTYMMTEKNSNWEYKLETTSPADIPHDEAQSSTPYTIKSYRELVGGTRQEAVAWRVIAYQESTNNGATWSAESQTKPAWLTNLTTVSGDGGTALESGIATVKMEYVDHTEAYNNVLKTAQKKGSAGNPYNLANQTDGSATIQNTANSYLISAPGYYRIPLVYGNAIHTTPASPNVGVDNQSSYKTSNTGAYILTNFKDHNEVDITSPYINVQNAANPATQASIVWTDRKGIVEDLSVTNNGDQSFINFHVPATRIKNGNAVIAVKNASGTIMWSWHLWFDHADALEVIPCTNYQGHIYKFTKRNLGSLGRSEQTSYTQPRKARLKVEQVVGQGSSKKTSYIIITQKPYSINLQNLCLYYQFGRKDAFPSIFGTEEGSITNGPSMSIKPNIQNPGCFYMGTYHYKYCNLWSMENTVYGHNDNVVVKTIYDPCPVGFKMPASRAFTFLTTNGQDAGDPNVRGGWEGGFHFYNKIANPDATIFFPVTGIRDSQGSYYTHYSYYSTAIPLDTQNYCQMKFDVFNLFPYGSPYKVDLWAGLAVRPVADE